MGLVDPVIWGGWLGLVGSFCRYDDYYYWYSSSFLLVFVVAVVAVAVVVALVVGCVPVRT